jgi:dephospho-CoA kinase
VIDNSGDLAELDKQVVAVVKKLRSQVAWYTWLACWLVPPIGLLKAALTVTWRLYFKKVGQSRRERKIKANL